MLYSIQIRSGLILTWIMILIDAVPWPFLFGGVGEINPHAGRIPQLDEFLRSHAAMLANPDEHRLLIPKAIAIVKQNPVDPESAKYYIELLMKIEKDGLETIRLERDIVNRNLATVMTSATSREETIHVMKQRHILDSFIDAAADVAWPWMRGYAKPNSKVETNSDEL